MSEELATDNAGDQPPRHPQPLPFQFNVRQLMIATLLLSIALGIEFGFTDWIASATTMIISVATVAGLVVAIIRSQGYSRAFCIGALFPMLPVALAAGGFYILLIFQPGMAFGPRSTTNEFINALSQTARGWRFAVATAWPAALIAGGISVIVHWSMRSIDDHR